MWLPCLVQLWLSIVSLLPTQINSEKVWNLGLTVPLRWCLHTTAELSEWMLLRP